MTKVTLEVDTDDGPSSEKSKDGKLKPTARKTFQVASTIRLDGDLRDAFEQGAGDQARFFDDKDYDDIANHIGQFNEPAFLVVTAGGSVAFRAAKTVVTNTRFVSLVGVEPAATDLGNCFGGVTLDSVKMNSDKVDYLESKGRTRSGIGLFCNRKSAMNSDEVANWATIPGVNQNIAYGGNAGGKNDPNTFPDDFRSIHESITTLVISADPFFQNQKNKLIKAANTWIDGNSARNVCYPIADYANSNGNHQPKPGKSWWYGPSLVKAYKELGKAAAQARDATSPIGFSSTTVTKGPF